MNPLDLIKKIEETLKTVDDLRKDKDLTADVIKLFGIVKKAGQETAREFPDDKELKKGFDSMADGIDIATEYLTKGKFSLSTKFSLPTKALSMRANTQRLNETLQQENHPVTKSVTDKITNHPDFDQLVARIYEKANDKMIRLTPTADGGMEVFELVTGQDLCIARLDKPQCERLNKTILARIPPKGGEGPKGPSLG